MYMQNKFLYIHIRKVQHARWSCEFIKVVENYL